jgi:hypothetical protein
MARPQGGRDVLTVAGIRPEAVERELRLPLKAFRSGSWVSSGDLDAMACRMLVVNEAQFSATRPWGQSRCGHVFEVALASHHADSAVGVDLGAAWSRQTGSEMAPVCCFLSSRSLNPNTMTGPATMSAGGAIKFVRHEIFPDFEGRVTSRRDAFSG